MGKEARSAGAIGCGPDEIEISDERRHGILVQSGQTWVASCRGRTFVCTQINESTRHRNRDGAFDVLVSGQGSNQVTCREEAETPQEEENREARRIARVQQALGPQQPPRAAPAGAGGFEFGKTREDTQRRCEEAGYAWSQLEPQLGRCSGTAAPLGFEATTAVRFCAGRACGVTLEHRPNASWSRNVVALKANLTSKYGPTEAATRGIPSACRTEGAFRSCLESQQLELSYSWRWATGERVTMAVGKSAPDATSSIRLVYTASSLRIDASAL
jgi:hypothetical protein